MNSQPNEEVQIEEQKYQSIHRDREGGVLRKVGIDHLAFINKQNPRIDDDSPRFGGVPQSTVPDMASGECAEVISLFKTQQRIFTFRSKHAPVG